MLKFRHRLSYRQARDAVVIAFVLGLIFALLQIAADLESERDAVDRTVHQVLKTLEAPAIQAAYNVDGKLASNVVYSLFEYRPIYWAALVDDFGDTLAKKQRPITGEWLSRLAEAIFIEQEIYTLPLGEQVTGKYLGELRVRVGTNDVNGKSILELMTLSACLGTVLEIRANGEGADVILDELELLVTEGFGEELES